MSRIEPFFFGPERANFGIYHPAEAAPRQHSVLIAGPLLNDIMRANFALRTIAVRLAGAGFDVMRFDYAGMGNSKQPSDSVRVGDWRSNVRDALDELDHISGSASVSVIAVRFSAYLVAELSDKFAFDKIVLWDPILDGPSWLQRLRDVQPAATDPRESSVAGSQDQMLGLKMHPRFESDLENSTPVHLNAGNVSVISTDNLLNPDGSLITIEQVRFACHWDELYAEVLHPHSVIEAICAQFQ